MCARSDVFQGEAAAVAAPDGKRTMAKEVEPVSRWCESFTRVGKGSSIMGGLIVLLCERCLRVPSKCFGFQKGTETAHPCRWHERWRGRSRPSQRQQPMRCSM